MTQTTSPRIAWLIPCYNEEQTIGIVIDQIRQHCPEGSITVCDNNSKDQTAAIAAGKGVRVLFEARQGKGHAIRSLFETVEADFFIMIDGDTTYDVGGWKRLADPVMRGMADMSVGARLERHGKHSFRRFHLFGNKVITGAINLFFDSALTDVLSGYRCFHRSFVKGIAINAKGFEIESELTIQACEHRYRTQEVPLNYFDRPAGSVSKLKTFNDGFIILYTILRLVKDHKPLTFFGCLAVVAGLCGALAYALGVGALTGLAWAFGLGSLFSGIILNAISQRTKELAQIVRKLSAANPDHPSP